MRHLNAEDTEAIRNSTEAFAAKPSSASLRGLLNSYVSHLAVLVSKRPADAAAALLLAMRERERALAPMLHDALGAEDTGADLHAKLVSRTTDLLHVLLSRSELPMLFGDIPINESGIAFFQEFFPIATDAAALALQANGIEGGMWQLAVESGSVIVQSTDLHSRVAEWDLNRREFDRIVARGDGEPAAVEQLLSEETTGAERRFLGFDSGDILDLVAGGFAALREQGGVHELEGGLWAIDSDRLEEGQQRIFRTLILDVPRVQRFALPFYFDLGAVEPLASSVGAAARTLTSNWTNYYPVYEGRDQNGRSRFLTSKMPLITCLGNMQTFRNRIFRRIVEAAGNTPTGREIARLDRKLMRRLEDAAARLAKEAGWLTRVRLKKDDQGADIECGEIDLLAVKTVHDAILVVLAEVKDLDLTPTSWPGGVAGMQAKLGRAFQQLDLRSRWVRGAWGAWLRDSLLGSQARRSCPAYLLPLVVTARYMRPFLFDRYVGVPAEGLRMFLAGFENRDRTTLKALAGETLIALETS